MPMITLVPEEFAEVGRTFDFMGEDPYCKDCRIRTICFNLQPGCRYRIRSLRSTYHNCDAAEGRVRVVEVERIQKPLAVDAKGAMEGATVTFERPECPHIGCPNYKLCCPELPKSGDKVTLVKVGKKLDCALGLVRVPVEIK